MDGLRLALIVAGVVIVAIVYLWTARRRRIDREAGSFDRFQAWSDDSVDPLVDDFDDPYERRSAGRGEADAGLTEAAADERPGDTREAPAAAPVPAAAAQPVPEPGSRGDQQPAGSGAAAAIEADDEALAGLEAIADTLGERGEPPIGRLDGLEAPPRAARPQPAPPPARRERAAGRRAEQPRERPRATQTELELEPPGAGEPDMVVVLNVMAREGERLEGEAVHAALERSGLRFGDMKAYHYFAAGQPAQALFTVLNAVKPGTLDPAERDELRTPGLAMVMSLPGPSRPLEAFETMHGIGRQLAEELDARLCDSTRSSLTRQAANHLREQIAEYGRRKRLGA